jgi:hypothetical protein
MANVLYVAITARVLYVMLFSLDGENSQTPSRFLTLGFVCENELKAKYTGDCITVCRSTVAAALSMAMGRRPPSPTTSMVSFVPSAYGYSPGHRKSFSTICIVIMVLLILCLIMIMSHAVLGVH